MHWALHLRDYIDYMCQEKKAEDSPALKLRRYNDSKTTYKRAEKNSLQRPETA